MSQGGEKLVMDVIVGGRRSGKTTRLIRLAESNRAVIICPSEGHCNKVRDEADRLGLKIPVPRTFNELIGPSSMDRPPPLPVIIDNADVLLRDLCGNKELIGVAICEDESPPVSAHDEHQERP